MEGHVWISHLQEIALEDDWVKVTDTMGRAYRLDPQAALELAVWVADHHQDVAKAQIRLQMERRMEEARLYGPLLRSKQPDTEEPPVDPSVSTPPSSLPKRQRKFPRKKEKRQEPPQPEL